MATVIRLARGGRKNLAVYRISVADASRPTGGKFLQQIGYYDPNQSPPAVKIDEPSVIAWLGKGAKPSPTVNTLLKRQGILEKWEQVKGGTPLEQAQGKIIEWQPKKKKPSKKILAKAKAEAEAKAGEEVKAQEEKAKAAEAEAVKETEVPAVEEAPEAEAKAENAAAETVEEPVAEKPAEPVEEKAEAPQPEPGAPTEPAVEPDKKEK